MLLALVFATQLDLLQENEGPVENTPPFDAIDNPGHGKEREKASTAGEATASVTASQGLQERRRRCLEWCLDHGFEYVEADCLHPEIGVWACAVDFFLCLVRVLATV